MKESAARSAARLCDVRNSELAKIHLAAKALGMGDPDYRALLQRVAGVNSAADLTAFDRTRLLDEFKRLGWRQGVPRGAGRRVPETDEPQIRLIRALWLELRDLGALRDQSQRALGRFCRRVTGVAAVESLDSVQAGKMIGALSQWKGRIERNAAEGKPIAEER